MNINTNLLLILKCARGICDQMKFKLIPFNWNSRKEKLYSLETPICCHFFPSKTFCYTLWSHDFKFCLYKSVKSKTNKVQALFF